MTRCIPSKTIMPVSSSPWLMAYGPSSGANSAIYTLSLGSHQVMTVLISHSMFTSILIAIPTPR